MNNKRHKVNNQLSLTLDPLQTTQASSPTVVPMQQRPASVIAFPIRQSHVPNFRERVIQDLMKTRVVVAD